MEIAVGYFGYIIYKGIVADRKNKDLEGVFHITSTWKKISDKWKMVFNMPSRIIQS